MLLLGMFLDVVSRLMMLVCVFAVCVVVLWRPEFVYLALFVSDVMMMWSLFVKLVCLMALWACSSVNASCK